jgi:thioredoxin-related protein
MLGAGQPMVVLFSQSGCGWCDRARVQLVPMAREAAEQGGAVFRQMDIDRDTPLVDFSGQRATHRRFSRAEGVRFTPTLIVFGPDGRQLAEPILGMRLPDFYAHYVAQAIDQARSAMMTNIEDAGK